MAILNKGDLVFYVRNFGDRPKTGHVSRVTKTRAYVHLSPVDGDREVGAFKRESWREGHEEAPRRKYGQSADVYPATTENERELNEQADKHEATQRAKKEERDRQVRERNEQIANELAEVRRVMNIPEGRPALPQIMPDGSRIYTIDIPVHPQFIERKKGWERVIVRCWGKVDYDFGKYAETGDKDAATVKVVSAAYTYCNGNSTSFSSVSTSRYLDDEAAIWDAIRREYHSW